MGLAEIQAALAANGQAQPNPFAPPALAAPAQPATAAFAFTPQPIPTGAAGFTGALPNPFGAPAAQPPAPAAPAQPAPAAQPSFAFNPPPGFDPASAPPIR